MWGNQGFWGSWKPGMRTAPTALMVDETLFQSPNMRFALNFHTAGGWCSGVG